MCKHLEEVQEELTRSILCTPQPPRPAASLGRDYASLREEIKGSGCQNVWLSHFHCFGMWQTPEPCSAADVTSVVPCWKPELFWVLGGQGMTLVCRQWVSPQLLLQLQSGKLCLHRSEGEGRAGWRAPHLQSPACIFICFLPLSSSCADSSSAIPLCRHRSSRHKSYRSHTPTREPIREACLLKISCRTRVVISFHAWALIWRSSSANPATGVSVSVWSQLSLRHPLLQYSICFHKWLILQRC